MSRSGEFELIRRFLAPLATAAGAGGLEDDAALLDAPEGQMLAVTTDTMVEGVHFPPDGPPDLIARRLLRSNLSDLAAMAARPEGYLLNLALPERIDDPWLESFAAGLAADQEEFGLSLFGGDTVGTPGALTLTVTAFGAAASPVRRSGARPGDLVFVTGPVGDGYFGLKAVRGELDAPRLAERYWLPSPRFGAAEGATAAADISDGLVADSGPYLPRLGGRRRHRPGGGAAVGGSRRTRTRCQAGCVDRRRRLRTGADRTGACQPRPSDGSSPARA